MVGLHQGVIALGGGYVETRLLSWTAHEPLVSGDRRLTPGENELVALDTDVVGCHGYYCDFSRTFHTGPDGPTRRQRELYRIAHEQVHHNMGLLRGGVSFREYAERAWTIPERFVANRYLVSACGCGMTGEYHYLYHEMDFAESGYDGVIEPGMTLCVESYIGEDGGDEGVKLEQQLLITEDEPELLTSFPIRGEPARRLGLVPRLRARFATAHRNRQVRCVSASATAPLRRIAAQLAANGNALDPEVAWTRSAGRPVVPRRGESNFSDSVRSSRSRHPATRSTSPT